MIDKLSSFCWDEENILTMYTKPYIIAEAGCNHMGQMEIAHELINVAAVYCKVDAIKFQKRCPKELLTPEQYNAPHPHPENSFGDTYGAHREFLEFTVEQHAQLKEWCEEAGITYSSSVWDLTSAKEIASLHPKFIKIPSASNTHFEMLQWLCDNYEGEIQLSFGMTSHEEEEQIVELFERNGRAKDLVIFDCTSGYPVPYEDVCLMEINRIKETYGDRVKAIGFSGHHLGIAVDVAAYTLGASVIERHYTLDRTWKGTDQAASLEPEDFKKLVIDLNNVHDTLSYKKEEILPIEEVQRKKLKYRNHTSDDFSVYEVNEDEVRDCDVITKSYGISEKTGFEDLTDKKEVSTKESSVSPVDVSIPIIKMFLTDCDGCLTDAGMYYSEFGDELKKFNTRDGMGFSLLHSAGIITGIITSESVDLNRRRAEKLNLDILESACLNKVEAIKDLCQKYDISMENVAYIGDDINDLEAIKSVGFGCCPADAIAEVRQAADYVARKRGGEGAVREVADFILQK